jgi:hypothetical protein
VERLAALRQSVPSAPLVATIPHKSDRPSPVQAPLDPNRRTMTDRR